MLNSLYLKNFKCYLDRTILFSNLTVFSGINGAGKSTAIQALLFLRQMFYDRTPKTGELVNLNGELVCFGNVYDILSHWLTGRDKQAITMTAVDTQGHTLNTIFKRTEGEEFLRQMSLEEVSIASMNLLNKDFVYLSAERSGPRVSFNVPDERSALNKYGAYGEYIPYYLACNEAKTISNSKLQEKLAEPEENNFRIQLENCFSALGKDVRIHADYQTAVEKISLTFAFHGKSGWGKEYRPINVGFGMTYALPVYVALLLANPGDLVIVENPEAHLHPKGQVAIGRFIALAAASGIQVIIETHSDHVLNGIRLAVKKEEVKNTAIKLNFIVNGDSAESVEIVSPNIMPSGRIDVWPEGFFDEYENTLAELF